jgi:hypothetical protein
MVAIDLSPDPKGVLVGVAGSEHFCLPSAATMKHVHSRTRWRRGNVDHALLLTFIVFVLSLIRARLQSAARTRDVGASRRDRRID